MTIKIRNWDRWQSYRKDRGQPPWIKLWRCLLRNPDFLLLTDAQRGQLMCLWILAADNNGEINMTADEIVRVCGMSSTLDLNALKDRRFVDFGVTVASRRRHVDATLTPSWRHGDASESESEAEAEKNPHEPTPPARATAFALDAAGVVAHLNQVTGRKFSAATATDQIQRALKAGATHEDCCSVIDHLWAKWKNDPKMVQFVDKVTPFRKANFDRYLDESKAGPAGAARDEIPFESEPWK